MRPLLCSLFAVCVLNLGQLNAAEPAVLIEHQGRYQGYFEQPRLSLVVTQINSAKGLYWPAAKLFKVDTESILVLEQQRKEVLIRLAALKQVFQREEEVSLVSSIETLEQDISTWQLAYRIDLVLDPDIVRAKKSLNPILGKGHYKLVVSGRPASIQIEGLVAQKETPLLNATSVDTYLRSISVLEGGSDSYVYILPAAGRFFLTETGLWNKKYQEISPGSVLFVPFERRYLPEAFNDINEQVLELLLHKVVVQ